LQSLPGIGAWTAHYIAMRALRWPDAFPAGDIALHNALGLRDTQSPTKRAALAEAASQAWRPWRSYAVFRIWAGLNQSHGNSPNHS
jgi:AraC family transcriptional regulator, regulatory protein of adaptative response / DNA-3-methyladenine glycosylase II